MNPRRRRDLVRLEGCHVGLSLTDGSRIDDCQLVFAGDDKLWVFENMADILAHPNAYKIPCLWEKPMEPTRVFGEGETFSWRGTTFQATKTPGQSRHHRHDIAANAARSQN